MISAVIKMSLLFAVMTATAGAPEYVALDMPPKEGRTYFDFRTLEREFGDLRGDYFSPDMLVSKQISEGLELASPAILLPDGDYLISGCRRHSCDEKAALVMTPKAQILASALVHYRCRWTLTEGKRTTDCDIDQPRLTIFVREANESPAMLNALRNWAAGMTKITEVDIKRLH